MAQRLRLAAERPRAAARVSHRLGDPQVNLVLSQETLS